MSIYLKLAKDLSRVTAQRQFDVDHAQMLLDHAQSDMMKKLAQYVAEVGADEAMKDSWASHWMLNGGDIYLQAKARMVLQVELCEELDADSED